jgi:hypothetical protein
MPGNDKSAVCSCRDASAVCSCRDALWARADDCPPGLWKLWERATSTHCNWISSARPAILHAIGLCEPANAGNHRAEARDIATGPTANQASSTTGSSRIEFPPPWAAQSPHACGIGRHRSQPGSAPEKLPAGHEAGSDEHRRRHPQWRLAARDSDLAHPGRQRVSGKHRAKASRRHALPARAAGRAPVAMHSGHEPTLAPPCALEALGTGYFDSFPVELLCPPRNPPCHWAVRTRKCWQPPGRSS